MKRIARVTVCVLILLACGSRWAAASARNVEIRWDFRKDSPGQLEVWVNCVHPGGDMEACAGTVEPHPAPNQPSQLPTGQATWDRVQAPDSYHFGLKRTDKVTLVLIDAASPDTGEADYAITGTNLDEKDIDQLKKLFLASAAAAKAAGEKGRAGSGKPVIVLKAVTDKLIAGGKLTATFNMKNKTGSGDDAKETITRSSGALVFGIQSESPRVTVSGGIGLSTARNPSVAIVKTSAIVTFTKDDKPQQAYEQVITLRDDDTKFKPVQSLITSANFRLHGRLYGSAAIRVDEKLFEQPILGFTYRHPLSERMGLNVTGGVMLSRETEILSESGFAAGQKIDPSIGLTADDIPTKTRFHGRPALLLTIDF
jgi:hypothetical protein